jgi:hypothetical protein
LELPPPPPPPLLLNLLTCCCCCSSCAWHMAGQGHRHTPRSQPADQRAAAQRLDAVLAHPHPHPRPHHTAATRLTTERAENRSCWVWTARRHHRHRHRHRCWRRCHGQQQRCHHLFLPRRQTQGHCPHRPSRRYCAVRTQPAAAYAQAQRVNNVLWSARPCCTVGAKSREASARRHGERASSSSHRGSLARDGWRGTHSMVSTLPMVVRMFWGSGRQPRSSFASFSGLSHRSVSG